MTAAAPGSRAIAPASLEHGPWARRADLLAYAAAIVVLAAWLVLRPAADGHGATLARVLAGVVAWTLIEYLVHRFVLHRVHPFKGWHAAHHARPQAAIGLPTPISAALFAGLVYAPAAWLAGPALARDFTLGVLVGYLAYALVHQGVHRPAAGRRWLARQRRWHARHHAATGSAVAWGVTSAFWDHVFGTSPPRVRVRRRTDAAPAAAHPAAVPHT